MWKHFVGNWHSSKEGLNKKLRLHKARCCMIYEYQCPKCHAITDVHKPVAEYQTEERCPGCPEEIMFKLFSPPLFHGEKPFDAHFNHAFGKVIKTKQHQKNVISELNDKTGMKIEPVGTDNLDSIKRQRKEYTLD